MVARTRTSRRNAATQTAHLTPLSTLAFDWVYTLFVFLVAVGVYIDGWSHASFGPDQSVLSEYHLLFYASLMALGLWLFGTAFSNRRAGFSGLNALPAGYKLSALGLFIFGVTGVFDLGGHALFGFEVDNEALYSPTHLGLFLGWALLSVGPAKAAYRRREVAGLEQGASQKTSQKTSWWTSFLTLLPALIAWASFFNILAFVAMDLFGTSAGFMLSENRARSDYIGETLGISGVIIQTATTVGVLAWLTLRFRLPAGAFTLFFSLYGLYGSVLELDVSLVPVFFVVGALCDALYALLKPSARQRVRFHLFNVLVALSLWATFYAFVFLTDYGGGVWYTPYIWTGSVAQALAVALLVSLLSTSAPSTSTSCETQGAAT